jgi:hypothetical protein
VPGIEPQKSAPVNGDFGRISLLATIWNHPCDWHGSHYVNVMPGQIFGENNFQNEIVC